MDEKSDVVAWAILRMLLFLKKFNVRCQLFHFCSAFPEPKLSLASRCSAILEIAILEIAILEIAILEIAILEITIPLSFYHLELARS